MAKYQYHDQVSQTVFYLPEGEIVHCGKIGEMQPVLLAELPAGAVPFLAVANGDVVTALPDTLTYRAETADGFAWVVVQAYGEVIYQYPEPVTDE